MVGYSGRLIVCDSHFANWTVCILNTEETPPPGFNYEVKCGNVGLWTPGRSHIRGGRTTKNGSNQLWTT